MEKETIKNALLEKICPNDGTELGGQNGKVICEDEDCDFVVDFREVIELLGENPYSVTIRTIN